MMPHARYSLYVLSPGWLDNEPARVTSRMEIRPAAELGPIILCLDTSGSMRGARETVAKALALECLRGAHRQRRACYLYAFSGPSGSRGSGVGQEALAGRCGMAWERRKTRCCWVGGSDGG